jgi:WD40 repeat protein/DNA-binding SARP family transcriptional activator
MAPGPHERPRLAGLLWPEQPESAARQNLRQTLLYLRQALGDSASALLDSTNKTLELNIREVNSDVTRFQDLLAECNLHAHEDLTRCPACLQRLLQAVELYQGEFLQGLMLKNAQPFEEWMLYIREQLHRQVIFALHALAAHYEQTAEYAQVQHYAQRQLALEPWREEAHRQMMLALAGGGQRTAALAQYEACCQVLENELGAPPSAETIAVYEQIRSGDWPKRAAPAGQEEPATQAVRPAPAHRIETIAAFDWSEAPETGAFFGRQSEIAQLSSWLARDRCRLVALLGMGGIGKTTLAATVAKRIASQFDRLIWRSLLNAPPLEELLRGLLSTLAMQNLAALPANLDEQLSLLINILRQQRCLLVLDNLESILHPEQTGSFRPGYEPYGSFLRLLVEQKHASSLLFTSRERPQGVARWEEDLSQVRTMRLDGLGDSAVQTMLAVRGFAGQAEEMRTLTARYSGNPLALKLVSETVHELFAGDIADFLRQETLVFDDIRSVLDEQFRRLLRLEQEMLIWLAVEREPTPIQTLRENLLQTPTPRLLIEALRSLQRRSLLEQIGSPPRLFLQNVVSEYIADRLVEQICQEIEAYRGRLSQQNRLSDQALNSSFLNRFALLKAQAKEYVRQSQERLFLRALQECLLARNGKASLVEAIRRILTQLRTHTPLAPGYAAGNLLNLLLRLGVDVTGFDFSELCVWQAHLAGMTLPQINFAQADLREARFTDSFNTSHCLAYTPDGEYVVAGLVSGEIRFWRAKGGELAKIYQEHRRPLHSIAFSQDGARLASGGEESWVGLWDARSGELLCKLEGFTGRVLAVAFSPDGAIVACGGEDMTIHLWDVRTLPNGAEAHKPIAVLSGHTGWVRSLAFSPNGEHLVSGGFDRTVRIWHWRGGRPAHVIQGHNDWVWSVAVSPDGNRVASGSKDRTIGLWDIRNPDQVRSLATLQGHSGGIYTVAFSPDGAIVASSSEDCTIRLWDVAAAEPVQIGILYGHKASVLSLAFNPSGDMMASGSDDHTVGLWSIDKPRQAQALTLIHGWFQGVRTIAFSPSADLLASAAYDQRLCLWDGSRNRLTGKDSSRILHSFSYDVADGVTFGFSADGRWLIYSGVGAPIQVYDGVSRQTYLISDARAEVDLQKCSAVAISPQAEILACGNEHGVVQLWKMRYAEGFAPQGRVHQTFHQHTQAITALAFSPDSRRLASSSQDGKVCLWDAQSGSLILTLHKHTNVVWSVAFSPDGALLASSSSDRTVCLWDVQTGELIRTFADHHARVFTVAFSPDGTLLASGGADQCLRLWEVESGVCRHVLQGHSGWVWSTAFHPSGEIVATSSIDETIKFWDVRTGAFLTTWRAPGPYAGMNISNVTGITDVQKAALKALGAVEDEGHQ